MSNPSFLNEIDFLFKEVLKVNVLTHAAEFKEQSPEQFSSAIKETLEFATNHLSKLQDVKVNISESELSIPSEFQVAWQEFKKSNILKYLIPKQYGGDGLPKTVSTAVKEALIASNPSFYIYVMLNLEAAGLIEKFGTKNQNKQYCQKLYNLEWSGALSYTEAQADCEWDAIETYAKPAGNSYSITGQKSLVAAGMHGLTQNIVHLVLAKLEISGEKDALAWFIVPQNLDENGKPISNNITVESCQKPVGLEGVPFCTLNFGNAGTTKGELLCKTGDGAEDLYQYLNGVRFETSLQSVALSNLVLQQVIKFACSEKRTISPLEGASNKRPSISLASYPHIADHLMFIKSVSEGLRAAVYSISFFDDCSAHGGKEQIEFFSDLKDFYTGILKVYATVNGLRSVRKAIQVFGRDSITQGFVTDRSYRNLQAGTLFGGANEIVAQEVLDRLVNYKNGLLVESLVKQFASVDVYHAKSEAMSEAIGIWQDYIGGIIVLADDLKKDVGESNLQEEVDPRLSNLWASRIVQLFGDTIVAYHLISIGLEAEKKLEALGMNFYNLQQEASRNPEMADWYNRLIAAEYFALNVLSENEGSIRIIQRNAPSALDAIFFSDEIS